MQPAPFERVAAQPARAVGTPGRIHFIDAIKALGIVLVVYGHAPGTALAAKTLIYSFHMPLFFFISGYLLRADRLAARPLATVRDLARSLLLPYLFFFVLSLAWWLATRGIGARAQKFAGLTVADAVQGFFTGIWSDLFVNVTLWFLPCLFVCQLVYGLARRHLPADALLVCATLLALLLLAFTVPWPTRLPWGLDIAWIAVVFFAAGHWLRVRSATAEGQPEVRSLSPLAALLLALCWLLTVALQGGVDLANANFGRYPLLYLPSAMAAIGCAVFLGLHLPPLRVATLLSQHSLGIFALHPLLFEFLSGVVKLSGLQPHVEAQPLAWSLVSTAWGLGTGLLASQQLVRHVPLLLGLRPGSARQGSA